MGNRSIYIRTFIFFTLCILLFISSTYRFKYTITSNFKNNVVKSTFILNDDNLNETINLTGTYKYIENRLIGPYELNNYKDNFDIVPINVNGNLLNGHSATLYLKIYNFSSEDVVLNLNNIILSENIYFNGVNINYNSDSQILSRKNNYSVTLEKDSRNEFLIQLKRNNFFMLGMLTPPTIMTTSNYENTYLKSQVFTVSLTLTIFFLSIFLTVLSILSTKYNKQNSLFLHVFISIGIIITSRTLFEFLIIQYSSINIPYHLYLKIQSLTSFSILYLLFLFTYFIESPNTYTKQLFTIVNYITAIFFIFTLVCPISGEEFLYKLGLILSLLLQMISLATASYNMHLYKKGGLYSFIVINIFYIFVYAFPTNFLEYKTSHISIAYILSCFFIISFLSISTFIDINEFKYITKKQRVLNVIYSKQLHYLEKHLEIEKNGKKHAIKINDEIKKRDIATGLYNRYFMINELDKHIKNLTLDKLISFIFVDIDNLKHINTVYGNNKADAIINEITDKLLSNKSLTNYITRWSGGTFLIALVDVNHFQAPYIAEHIRLDISTIKLTDLDSPTVSIGVCYANKDSNMKDIEIVLNKCLEKAKSNGKNYVYTDNALIENLNHTKQYTNKNFS